MPNMREFDLLQHVFAANASLGARIEVPPGDDMAVIRLGEMRLLAAVDQLVDGVHVRLQSTPIELVGRKAITRSLSDVAAMAAKPVATLVAATLPPAFGKDRANAMFEAMRETAARYGCPLVGGDLAFSRDPSHPMICSVTVLAEAGLQPPVTRGGAAPGDDVYVTGNLGGAYAADGSGKHLTFKPRIAEALELSSQLGRRLHAMIDISDGLGRDAGHIAEMSHVQIQIEAELVPCTTGRNWRQAVSDGEDYELCFTASGDVPDQIIGVEITRIGRVLSEHSEGSPHVVVRDAGVLFRGDELGWQHASC